MTWAETWRSMTNLASRLNFLSPVLVERTPSSQPKVAVLECRARVLWEDRSVQIKGGVLVDEFKPFAVHVYRMAQDGRSPRIDWSSSSGAVKPVNGVGQPPMNGMPRKANLMHYLKEAGVPYARLHDVGGAMMRRAAAILG